MSEEIETYLDFKLKTYASLSVKDIPMIELRQFSCELVAYIDGKSSPKRDVTDEQKQPSLIPDFDVDEKPRFIHNTQTRFTYPESRAIFEYMRDNVKQFGQKIRISPDVINIKNPNIQRFDTQVNHLSNYIYKYSFPNVKFSYRRLPTEDHAYVITVLERRD